MKFAYIQSGIYMVYVFVYGISPREKGRYTYFPDG